LEERQRQRKEAQELERALARSLGKLPDDDDVEMLPASVAASKLASAAPPPASAATSSASSAASASSAPAPTPSYVKLEMQASRKRSAPLQPPHSPRASGSASAAAPVSDEDSQRLSKRMRRAAAVKADEGITAKKSATSAADQAALAPAPNPQYLHKPRRRHVTARDDSVKGRHAQALSSALRPDTESGLPNPRKFRLALEAGASTCCVLSLAERFSERGLVCVRVRCWCRSEHSV
jgi:hypothetical protein